MKEFFNALLDKYFILFGIIVLLIIAVSFAAFALSPIILAVAFENGWYLLLYVIVGPIFSVIIDE